MDLAALESEESQKYRVEPTLEDDPWEAGYRVFKVRMDQDRESMSQSIQSRAESFWRREAAISELLRRQEELLERLLAVSNRLATLS